MIREGDIYTYKGNRYEVVHIAKGAGVWKDHVVVIYEPLYECPHQVFVRPVWDFLTKFDKEAHGPQD